jgi:hypothetical protein
MTKNKLYSVLLIVVFSGYSYLYYSLYHSINSNVSFCIFKNVTGFPCPSCGTTRAVQLFLQGDFVASLQMNPFGILVAILMVVLPFWIVYDVLTHQQTFFINYKKVESIVRTKWLAILLIILVLINWIWNIKKGL